MGVKVGGPRDRFVMLTKTVVPSLIEVEIGCARVLPLRYVPGRLLSRNRCVVGLER